MLHDMRRFEVIHIDFLTEWLSVAGLAILAVVLARVANLHLIATWHDGIQVAAGLGVMLVLKIFVVRRGSMMAEYFALGAAATSCFVLLSYVCLAMSGPLIDSRLLAADQALRFDWMAGYNFLRAHPAPQAVLKFSYNSMVYQDLYFCVLMSLMGRKHQLRQVFWIVFVSGLFTCLGVALFPALGPYKSLGITTANSFLPEMEHLKSGHNLVFALSRMTGVISFPSFHTVMALTFIWGFRRTDAIRWGITTLNVLMLLSIPWFGGHYLVDVIAGAGVMLASLTIVKFLEKVSIRVPWKAQSDIAAGSSASYFS